MRQVLIINPLVEPILLYGPTENVNEIETTDLCQHVKPFLSNYYNSTWKLDNFCEQIYCQQNSIKIKFNTTLQQKSLFAVRKKQLKN